MNTKSLGKLLSASGIFMAFAGSAFAYHESISDPVPLGDGSYSIKVEANSAFDRDTDKMRAEANAAAEKFCSDQHKYLKVLSLTDKMPWFSTGYASATIIFNALDSEAMAQAAAPAAGMGAPMVAPAPRNLTTDELYAELTKLDDLRKKGILTDDEFQAEKKKVLSHSN